MNGQYAKRYTGLTLMTLLLTLLLLWGMEALGGWGVALLPLLLPPLCIPTWEKRYGALLLSVLVPAAVLLVLPFPHYAWFGFVAVLSWYAPARTALLKLRAVWARTVIALLLCNAGLAAGFIVLHFLGAHPLAGLDPFELSILFLGIELLLVALDLVFTLFRKIFPHIRRMLFV